MHCNVNTPQKYTGAHLWLQYTKYLFFLRHIYTYENSYNAGHMRSFYSAFTKPPYIAPRQTAWYWKRSALAAIFRIWNIFEELCVCVCFFFYKHSVCAIKTVVLTNEWISLSEFGVNLDRKYRLNWGKCLFLYTHIYKFYNKANMFFLCVI